MAKRPAEAEENSKRPADDGPVVTPELMRVYYEKVRPSRLPPVSCARIRGSLLCSSVFHLAVFEALASSGPVERKEALRIAF